MGVTRTVSVAVVGVSLAAQGADVVGADMAVPEAAGLYPFFFTSVALLFLFF